MRQLQEGTLPHHALCSIEENLEANILHKVSTTIIHKAGKSSLTIFGKSDAPSRWFSGFLADYQHFLEDEYCVGQQAISGKRVPNGFEDSFLPHYSLHSKVPVENDIVTISFYS